eukprot:11065681-Lingulodinium_polyedra.AAC.1
MPGSATISATRPVPSMLGPRFLRLRKACPAARSACCRSMGASCRPSGRRAATACTKTASGDSESPCWSSGAPSAGWTSRGSGP